MKSTHAVECIGANDNVGGMSQTAIADATSPSSSSPASGLERKRRSPPSDLSPNKRLSRQERRREEEPPYAAPPVFTRILADKSNFKDIVHHFTGIRTSSMRPLFHRSKKPATSQIFESTCSCQCYKDGHWCADKAVLYTVCQRMRVLEAATAHLLLRQGCLTTAHRRSVTPSICPRGNRLSAMESSPRTQFQALL